MLEFLKDIWVGLWALFRFTLRVGLWCGPMLLLEFFVPGAFQWIALAVFVLFLLQQLGSLIREKP